MAGNILKIGKDFRIQTPNVLPYGFTRMSYIRNSSVGEYGTAIFVTDFLFDIRVHKIEVSFQCDTTDSPDLLHPVLVGTNTVSDEGDAVGEFNVFVQSNPQRLSFLSLYTHNQGNMTWHKDRDDLSILSFRDNDGNAIPTFGAHTFFYKWAVPPTDLGGNLYHFGDSVFDGVRSSRDAYTSQEFNTEDGDTPRNLCIFGRTTDNAGGNSECPFVGKIFYVKVYDANDTLIREFVPAKRIFDGEIGFYETLTGTFVAPAFDAELTTGGESPLTVVTSCPLKNVVYESTTMSLDDKITCDLYYKNNTIQITGEEYVEYDGVRFLIVNPPTAVREGIVSDNSELKGMTKYSFEFYHPMYQLHNLPFSDVAVSLDETRYLSEKKTFSWIGKPQDFVDKLNKNLEGTVWRVVKSDRFPEEKENELSEVLSFDNSTIADALKTGYETWDVPYIISTINVDEEYYTDGKRFLIIFGLPFYEIYANDSDKNNGTPFTFLFGQGVGLKNNSRTPRKNKIVTRIAGYGSENNIPYGYPQVRWFGDVRWDYTTYQGDEITYDVDGKVTNQPSNDAYPLYMGVVNGQWVKLIKHPFTRTHLMPSVYTERLFNKVSPLLADGTENPNYDQSIELLDYYDAVASKDYPFPNPINTLAPSYESHEFDIKPELGEETLAGVEPYDDYYTSSQNFDDFMLRIQGDMEWVYNYEFPFVGWLSMYNAFVNIRTRVLTWHNGAELIEGTEIVSSAGSEVQATASVYRQGNYIQCRATVDGTNRTYKYVVWGERNGTKRMVFDDSMDKDGKYVQEYFCLTLPKLSFDLYACALVTEEMQINMRSGACLGCTFDIRVDWDDYKANFYKEDGSFDPQPHTQQNDGHIRDTNKYPDSSVAPITVIVKKDTNTFGTLMPNIYQQPLSGDEFVILGIALPQSYIARAETRLDDEMKSYMLANNVYYYDYPLKFDEHFLYNHPYILSQLKPPVIVHFQYGNELLHLYVKKLTIKYGGSVLPQYDITLTDSLDVTLNQIGQVVDDVEKMGAVLSALRSGYSKNVWGELKKKLSKDNDDYTPYTLGMKDAYVDDDLDVGGTATVDEVTGHNGRVWVRSDVAVSGGVSVGGDQTVGGNQTVAGETQLVGDTTFGPVEGDRSYAQGTKGAKIFWSESGWEVETDYLTVHKRMYVKDIQVDEVTHTGGENLLTEAACVADFVLAYRVNGGGYEVCEPTDGDVAFFRVFFRRSSGEGRTIHNQWRVGDQAYCQLFNIDAGVSTDFRNKYYWRLVTGTSSKRDFGTAAYGDDLTEAYSGEEGEYHFVDLSNTDKDTAGALRKDTSASSIPEAEDSIVQLGYRGQDGDDPRLVSERQGATLISGGGNEGRCIKMYEGISSYILPAPRVLLSPQAVNLTVDELHIKTSGGQSRTLMEYVEDNTDQFVLFETGTEEVPTVENAPYTTWTAAERVRYSTPPNNAVVLNSDGRTWRFVREEESGYAFEEFTDPWLLAQHNTVQDILDDNAITEDEVNSFRPLYAQVQDEGTAVEDEMMSAGWETPPAALQAAFEAYQSAYSALTTLLDEIFALTPPIHLVGYTGQNMAGTSFERNREDITSFFTAYRLALYKWQSALSSYKTEQIGESAAQSAMSNAVQYVTEHIDEVAESTIESYMKKELEGYATNKQVSQAISQFTQQMNSASTAIGELRKADVNLGARIDSTDTGIQATNDWLGVEVENGKAVVNRGTSGMISDFSRLFTGTAYNTLETDGSGHEVFYDLAGQDYHFVTQDATDKAFKYTMADGKRTFYDKDGAAIAAPNMYPRVVTTGKSGLVTDKDFASLFAKRVDEDEIAKTASVATMIKEGISTAVISAEQVFIQSGKRNLGNCFELDGSTGNVTLHDLYANDITVEGVINNMAQTLHDSNAAQENFGRYGYPRQGYGLFLDPLAVGNVIYLDGTWHTDIWLPVAYAEPEGSGKAAVSGWRVQKVYAGNTETYGYRKYTLADMRQCVGKRLYLLTAPGGNGSPALSIHCEELPLVREWEAKPSYPSEVVAIDEYLTTYNGRYARQKGMVAATAETTRHSEGLDYYGAPTNTQWLILECCLGEYKGRECFYWKITLGPTPLQE